MSTIQHKQWGETFDLAPKFGQYANGRLAIQLFDAIEGPFCTVTVNMVDAPDLPEGEVYVKDWSENEEIIKTLVESGWLVDTGRSVPAGYVSAKVMRLGDSLAEEEERQWKMRAISEDINALAESMGPGVTVTRLSAEEVKAMFGGER